MLESGFNTYVEEVMPTQSGARRNRSKINISDTIKVLTELYGPVPEEPRLDPSHELVFTILSQHTSDTNSGRAFTNLMKTFGSLESVAKAPVEDIHSAISGGGLAKIKAPRIKNVLNMILTLNQNSLDLTFLQEMPLEEAKSWLKQLPGIGPKSAGIVLSFSLGMPAMAVDTHIHRVSKRLGLIGPNISADKAHDILESVVNSEEVYPFHFAIITHGRQVCRAQSPLCSDCVLDDICPSHAFFTKGNSTNTKSKPINAKSSKRQVPHAYPTQETSK
jgi:endonuclease-3